MHVTLIAQEYQGLYGPFQVSELLIQKIWLKGAFDASRLLDERGRSVAVIFPGRWNRLGGPDFLDAILRVDGELIEGDVEIHFSKKDWWAHRHGDDPRYGNVALHVVYQPVESDERETLTATGKAIPTVSLMDLLWYDLEEYASEDSIIESTRTQRDEAIEALFEMSLSLRRETLVEAAKQRWRLKRHFGKKRIERSGWESACHMSALEILGFAANRIPMLFIAGSYSLEALRKGDCSVDDLWREGAGRWSTEGVRPSNFPRNRLRQYLEWVKRVPRWPESLRELGDHLPPGPIDSPGGGGYRRAHRFGVMRNRIARTVVGEQVGGSRLDTLICDGFMPLLAAANDVDLSNSWFHWFAGDVPDRLVNNLKQLQVIQSFQTPLSNGWTQGLLGLRD